MTEKEQQPVTPEIPTEAADKPESDNPPKNENRRGENQAERERTIAQNRQRLREIVDVVRKHDILHGITPEKLCAIIEDLGPTFIKLGQILSMRSDILPRDYCEALKKLRSNVSPMPFEQVQRVVETSYGCPMEEVFASFDEKALGSASIAQAHAAVLKSGESVVVKVQREGIHEVMSRDIILLKQACKVLKYTPAGSLVDFNQVLDEMWVVAQEEMNFQTEAANLERFHALNQDVVFVTSPILYRAYTTTNVLVMERIDGMGIDEHDKLVEAGYDLAEIGAKLADNYVRQIMEDGFFHADPHPGNIRIRDGKIVWLDMGMMGSLNEKERKLIGNAIVGVARGDIALVRDAALGLDEKLTSSDVLYLALLYEQDGRTQDEMAEAYTVDRAATTRSLQGLEKKGLVRREVDTFDRRIRRVYLTEKAMQYRTAIRRMADDLADALFEGMSEEEVKAFMEQVEAMGQRARRLNQRQERLKAQGIDK